MNKSATLALLGLELMRMQDIDKKIFSPEEKKQPNPDLSIAKK